MYQEEFLPVVFNVRFSSNQALPVEKWRSRIHDVLHLYVDQICINDDRVIGHIKALAQVDETDFIKYSCISNSNAINSKFHGNHQDIFDINVIINSLVSNISENESRVFLERSCQAMVKQDSGIKVLINKTQNQLDSHHHHHGDGDDCPICNGHHH
ncbi:MAG: hypothetical protein CVV01_02320 [Firmicutes bacterium HGW-Firmicutes-6]|jgi:hypothetical protein|nr:MAG: hypothetical protein CVV01_02320 [Firmicutes bacterium HGW-Firmicutes-6]PKM53309.1 MAG: hypothetical protein CVV00_12940 [Firmicutes bacterium HGW-Firmicutes-5]